MHQNKAANTSERHYFMAAHSAGLSLRTALISEVVICLILFVCAFQMKSYQNSEFDEGVYLATFKSVQNGYAPYSQTYLSQPPGFFVTTFPLYVMFGSTLEAARLAVFFYSLVGLLAIVWMGWELRSVLFAFIAISALYLIPLYTVQILTFHGDSLPAAFSALALASMLRFRNKGHWIWVALSAVFVVTAVMIKGDFAVVPSLALVLLVATVIEKRRIIDFFRYGMVFAAAALVTFLAFTLPFGISEVYTNVVELRLRVAQGTSADPNTFFTFLNEQAELVNILKAASVISVLAFIVVKDARFPLIVLVLWLGTTIVSLLVYYPLLAHHMAFLTVPSAVLFAFALFKLLNLIRLPYVVPAVVTVMLILTLVNRFNSAAMPQSTQSATPLQLRGIELVQTHTQPGDYIISDDGIVSALSDRLIPPYLTDISFVRIASGGVNSAHLEDALKTYRPKMLLVWADRLRNVPNFEQLMNQYDYRLIEDPDTQHQAYLLDP